MVFFVRQFCHNNWVTAIFEIFSKDSPLILKNKFDEDLMHIANNFDLKNNYI